MIRNMAGFTTGYLQVHGNGYWEEKIWIWLFRWMKP